MRTLATTTAVLFLVAIAGMGIQIVDVNAKQIVYDFKLEKTMFQAIALTADSKRLATVGAAGETHLAPHPGSQSRDGAIASAEARASHEVSGAGAARRVG